MLCFVSTYSCCEKRVEIRIVNNSANINKTNNYHSSLLTKHKKASTYDVRNPGPDRGQTQTYDSVKPVNGISKLPFWLLDLNTALLITGSQHFPFDYWISNTSLLITGSQTLPFWLLDLNTPLLITGSQHSPSDYWIAKTPLLITGSQTLPFWLLDRKHSPFDYWISKLPFWLLDRKHSPFDYWISKLPFWLLDRQPKYIYKQTIKYLHRFASTQQVHILSQTHKWIWLWRLTPLSTILQLYPGGQFIGRGNRNTRWKQPTCHKSLTNFFT